MEDDIRFLKDPSLVAELLKRMPDDDIVLFDSGFIWDQPRVNNHVYQTFRELCDRDPENPYGSFSVTRDKMISGSAACFSLSAKAIRFILDFMDTLRRPVGNDTLIGGYDYVDLTRSFAKLPLAIQQIQVGANCASCDVGLMASIGKYAQTGIPLGWYNMFPGYDETHVMNPSWDGLVVPEVYTVDPLTPAGERP